MIISQMNFVVQAGEMVGNLLIIDEKQIHVLLLSIF